jgi:hypothetical protein
MKLFRLPVFLALLCLTAALAEPEEQIPSRIKRQPVVSTNVSSVGYSRQLRALEIEFSRGAIYRFLEVQPRIYRDLMAASSKGRFIAQNIRGKYRFVRVRSSQGKVGSKRLRLTTNDPKPRYAAPAP